MLRVRVSAEKNSRSLKVFVPLTFQLQEAERPRPAVHGVRQGIAGIAGREGGVVVGARAAVLGVLRRRWQPGGLLYSRHGTSRRTNLVELLFDMHACMVR
jgi:hypothetical protein